MVFESNTLDMLVLHEGVTKYFWVKYSMYPQGVDTDGNVSMTDESDNAVYIGICYNQVTTDESNDPADYQWSKIHGDDGAAAFTIILSNENISFSTTEDNVVLETQRYVCTVQVYQGFKQITDFTIDAIPENYDGIDIDVQGHQIIISAEAGNKIPVEYGVYTINADIVGEIPVAGEEPILSTIPVYKELSWNLAKQGITGIPGFSVIVGNESQNIPCDKDGYVLEDTQIEIPFYAFEGLERVWCSATYDVLPEGMYYASNLSDDIAEINSTGCLVFVVTKGTSLGLSETLTGKIDLIFTISSDLYGERKTSKNFSWTKSLQGIDGILTLYEIKPSCEFMSRSAVEYSDTGDYKIMPESVTFSANYTQTMNEGKHEFSGFFRIEETVRNQSSSIVYQSVAAESSVSYIPSNTSVTNVKCTLYENSDFFLELDVVNIPVISDGSVYDAIQTLHTEMKGVKSIIDVNSDPPSILEQAWENSQITVVNTSTGETVSQTFTDLLSSHETNIYGIEQRVKKTEFTSEQNSVKLTEHQSVIDQHAKDITIAVSSANSALSQLDNKNSNFTTKTPEETISPPYVKGDLWVRTVYVYNEDGSIKTDDAGNNMVETVVYQCNTTVEDGEFDESHWEIADYATTSYVEAAIEVEANKIEMIVSDSGEVTPASLILAINENDESTVKISAENLELDGYVTFTNLATSGETIIDGGNITTGIISADRIEANSITGDKIAANTITGDRIAANTLTSTQIDVDSLFAGDIDATNANIKNATMTNATMTTATITNANINDCTINSSLNAKHLTGTISDSRGLNSWNLSTGQLTISGYVKDGDLSTKGSTSINGGNIQTGTIGSDKIDVDDLFAQDITATNMTITGTSKFITEDDGGAKVTIEDGSLLCEYKNDNRLIAVTYESIKLCTPNSSTDVPIEFWNLTSNSMSRIGKIGKGGFYTGNNNSSPFLDWSGNFQGKEISGTTINATSTLTLKGKSVSVDGHTHSTLYNGDNTGYVGLYKDGSYYYLRPYAASKVYCGSTNYPWYDTYTERLHITKEPLVCLPSWNDTSTNAANLAVGNTGIIRKAASSSSSRTIKHDIFDISTSTEIDPHKLYDLDIVQFKYNDGIITDKNDVRLNKVLPGFIIEDINEKYPIAVDKPSDDVKDWAWNDRFLIPPMMKLIQEQHKEIEEQKSEINSLKADVAELKQLLTNLLK